MIENVDGIDRFLVLESFSKHVWGLQFLVNDTIFSCVLLDFDLKKMRNHKFQECLHVLFNQF